MRTTSRSLGLAALVLALAVRRVLGAVTFVGYYSETFLMVFAGTSLVLV